MPSLRFVYSCLGDLQITACFKGIYATSGTASVFDDADNATCKSMVGLPYSVLPFAERTIFGFGCKRTIGAWIHACKAITRIFLRSVTLSSSAVGAKDRGGED